MIVPAGHVIRSAHVPTADIEFPMDGGPMAVASVEEKVRMFTGMGDGEPYPLPVGSWRGDRFRLWDGRHRYIASLMLGRATMLVCWTEADDG